MLVTHHTKNTILSLVLGLFVHTRQYQSLYYVIFRAIQSENRQNIGILHFAAGNCHNDNYLSIRKFINEEVKWKDVRYLNLFQIRVAKCQ